jgi:hypothetical protein
VGPAEVIVLVEESPNSVRNEKTLLGLFTDEPEIVDEAMEHVRTQRRDWRIRPAT